MRAIPSTRREIHAWILVPESLIPTHSVQGNTLTLAGEIARAVERVAETAEKL